MVFANGRHEFDFNRWKLYEWQMKNAVFIKQKIGFTNLFNRVKLKQLCITSKQEYNEKIFLQFPIADESR